MRLKTTFNGDKTSISQWPDPDFSWLRPFMVVFQRVIKPRMFPSHTVHVTNNLDVLDEP